MAGGQSSTVSAGFLGVDRGHGQGAQTSAGTIAAVALTVALVGTLISGATGKPTPSTGSGSDLTLALTGSESATGIGTLVAPGTQALSGIASTSGIGTLTVVIRPTDISNPAITSAAGILTAQGSSVTVNITGSDIFTATGIVGSGSTLINGQASTGSAGTAVGNIDVPLIGAASACAVGSVSPSQGAVDTLITSDLGSTFGALSVALVGAASTGAQGALGISGDSTAALSGSASTTAAGTIGAEKDFPLTGSEFTGVQYNVGAPGGASLTGSSVSVVDGNVFITNDRSFALVGQSVSVVDGITFASSLAFPPGLALVSALQGIGPRGVDLIGVESQTQAGIVSPPLPVVPDQPGGGANKYAAWNKVRWGPKRKEEPVELAPAVIDTGKPTKAGKPIRSDPADKVVAARIRKAQAEEDEAIIKAIIDML